MKPVTLRILPLVLIAALLATSLAVCNAHSAHASHPDCPHADFPTSLPLVPHHCAHHPCPHLHLPFLSNGGVIIAPAVGAVTLRGLEAPLGQQEALQSIFQPPKA